MSTEVRSQTVEEALVSFHSAIQGTNAGGGLKNEGYEYRVFLESADGFGSPTGVVTSLVPRLFAISPIIESVATMGGSDYVDANETIIAGTLRGNDALAVLARLVETQPDAYLVPAARAIREAVSTDESSVSGVPVVSDDLIAAIAKILVAYDDAVGPAADASAALFELCRRNRDSLSASPGDACRRVLHAVAVIWRHLESLSEEARRSSSIARMRCASLVVDVCLLGNDEMSCSLNIAGDGKHGTLIDMLLGRVAFDSSDPLMQMSGLDQLERLANGKPMHEVRANYLVTNDTLQRGLMDLTGAGCDGDGDEKVGDREGLDPINGGAALRVLSSICRLGYYSDIFYPLCAGEKEGEHFRRKKQKWESLLSGFQRALHNFEPQGELERLAYVDAASSFASASSETATIAVDDPILRDCWLSLSVPQPKLKSAILASLGSVIEPGILEESKNYDVERDISRKHLTDVVALRLYEALGSANRGRNSTEIVLALAKSPFVEERLGAYTLLRAVAMRATGSRLLLLSGGFFEWLITRENERTKEGREAKFYIVQAILASEARGLLAENVVKELEKIEMEGPHYVQQVSREVATE